MTIVLVDDAPTDSHPGGATDLIEEDVVDGDCTLRFHRVGEVDGHRGLRPRGDEGQGEEIYPRGRDVVRIPGMEQSGSTALPDDVSDVADCGDAIVDDGVLAPHHFDGDTPEIDYFADEGGMR